MRVTHPSCLASSPIGESVADRKITTSTLCRRRSVSAPGQLESGTRGMGRATAMMGPAHSLSGAAAWLGVGAAAAAAGHPMPWPVLLVGALICAGAALAPDLDHKAATISRAFGPVSRWLCEVVDKLSYAVYKATRKPGDARRSGGHRTLTHTWLWAVLIGAGTSVAAITGGRWTVLAILFVHMVLAIEGLLWRAARGSSSDVLVWLLAATSARVLAGGLGKTGDGAPRAVSPPGG